MPPFRSASVVPLRRLPPHLSEFTYRIPAELPHITEGSVVRVPFKHSIITGVVVRVRDEDQFDAEVKDIASAVPLFCTKQQLAIARRLSDLYVQSLGIV